MTTTLEKVAMHLEVVGYQVRDSGQCLLIRRRHPGHKTWTEPKYVSKQGIEQAREPMAYALTAIGEATR